MEYSKLMFEAFFAFFALLLKGSYDAISSFPFCLECYKLIVYR